MTHLLRHALIFIVGMVATATLVTQTGYSQTINGSLSGTVKDASGGVIPNASIAIRNLDTGQLRELATDAEGFFRATALPMGEYSIEINVPGFTQIKRQPIRVDAAVERALDFTVQPSAASETITVIDQAPLIESTKAQISKGVEAKRIMELPGLNTLNGLALLQPGAVANNNGRPGSGFAVNGGRTRSNNFTIDGANNNDQSLSIPRQSLPAEALGAFRIITNNYSAEFGRNSGSVVNQYTRSGTNQYHGTVRWTWMGNSFDALSSGQERTYKTLLAAGRTEKQALRGSRAVTVRNQGLVSVGGPIKEDKLFFFTSYDREWYRLTSNASTTAISPEGYANLRANSDLWVPGSLDFLSQTFPVANDPTSRGTINISTSRGTVPVPLTLLRRTGIPYGTDYYRWLMKTDLNVSAKNTLAVRYLIDDTTDPGSPTAIPGMEIGSVGRNQSATINDAHVFGPRLINEARMTYSRRASDFPENLPPFFQITGFNSVGNYNYPQYRTDNVWEFTDNLTWIRGTHTLKTGFNLLRYQLNSFFAPNSVGSVYYPSLADLLYDRNASFSQYAGDGYLPARTSELSGFLQDDWRLRPSLTINAGIRYEYTGAPFGYFSNASPDINNWAPRLGFAWTPGGGNFLTGKNQFVVRGGWSVAYDQVFQNILLNVARNYPRGVTVALPPTSGQRYFEPANRPAPPTPDEYTGNIDLLPARLFAPDKRIRQPFSQQYSLGFEREFLKNYVFRAFYVGSRAVGLVREVERNIGFQAAAVNANPSVYADILPSLQPIRNASGQITSYRADPTRGSILVGDALAQSTYHSLQLTGEKRFSRGIQFELNYTWSSFINDSDDVLGGQTNSTLPSVPFNFRLDRGRSGLDTPHRMVLNYIWEMPNVRQGTGLLGRVAGGWAISGITTIQSGTPFTVLNANNALGILPGQVSTVEGSQRASYNPNGTPNAGTSANMPTPQFVANPVNSGIIGTRGRNSERTGGTVLFDARLMKRIRTFGESQNVEFGWDLFNLFNHRNFTTIPSNTVTNSTNNTLFLNRGQQSAGGRSMMFNLRYNF